MQAEKKQREIEIIELYNTSLLNNLLPNHVISHFLNPGIAVVSSCGNLRLCHFLNPDIAAVVIYAYATFSTPILLLW